MNAALRMGEIAAWGLAGWVRTGVLLLCVALFFGAFAVMFYSVWRHHRAGAVSRSNFHEDMSVELTWTLVPFLMVLALAWPVVRVLTPA